MSDKRVVIGGYRAGRTQDQMQQMGDEITRLRQQLAEVERERDALLKQSRDVYMSIHVSELDKMPEPVRAAWYQGKKFYLHTLQSQGGGNLEDEGTS